MRAEKLINDFMKRNVMKAWRNVNQYFKLEKEKSRLYQVEVKAQR